MRSILFVLLALLAYPAYAQDLTGIWRGHFRSANSSRLLDSLGIEDRYKFEVQLDQHDKSFSGVTYSYKTTVFYGKASCYGSVNMKNKKIFLEETKILEVKTDGGGACIMTCFLQYSKVDNEEFLEGTYTSMSTTDSSQCGKGIIFLRKVATSDFYREPFLAEKEKPKKEVPAPAKVQPAPPVKITPKKELQPPLRNLSGNKTKPVTKPATKPVAKPKQVLKPKQQVTELPKNNNELKVIPADSLNKLLGKNTPQPVIPRVLSTRTNELVRTISTSSKDILINIYDNGTIDNDTVSVYVDKKLVVSKQRLTEKAITLKISLDEKIQEHELVMVAENLGEIPPNTSLMVVNAGDQQYEVRITSTEQKNAVVLFKYDAGK
jgi:hypothetical protein